MQISFIVRRNTTKEASLNLNSYISLQCTLRLSSDGSIVFVALNNAAVEQCAKQKIICAVKIPNNTIYIDKMQS